ncbi:MAG TPA: hypothetical protein VI957_03025 [Candidatus Paceibacterota bacterium]
MSEFFAENIRVTWSNRKPRPELDWRKPFLTPSSPAEAMERQKVLRSEITAIERKLANRHKRYKFPNKTGYQSWRRKTIDAKAYREAELRRLKRFLREQSAE